MPTTKLLYIFVENVKPWLRRKAMRTFLKILVVLVVINLVVNVLVNLRIIKLDNIIPNVPE